MKFRSRSVHPHACGELLRIHRRSEPDRGSSPRLWGTQTLRKAGLEVFRFIPTLVGNSSNIFFRSAAVRVHPHACGELGGFEATSWAGTGSSPRLWGTRCSGTARRRGRRFIPTLVGNSYLNPGGCRDNPVHPHACGELSPSRIFRNSVIGSSPRLWGTLV